MKVFSLEKDVVSVLDGRLNSIFGEVSSVTEFSNGHGRPDIVCVTTSEQKYSRDYYFDYDTINFLTSFCGRKGKVVNISDIVRSNFFTEKKINEVVNLLQNENFIEKRSDGVYRVTRRYEPPLKDFISIEVKIKDWRQGYYQAVRYTNFSTRSYLAIASDYIQNVDKELLRRSGIGLISVSLDDANIVLRAREAGRTGNLSRYISMERFYAENLCR